MSLPKISVPTYSVTLPSTGKEVRIRPFLVKEEKLLLMAAQSKDVNEIIHATLQAITNCLIDDDIDASKLPFFDVDYLFIALRAKSIGESIEINFTCNNVVDEEKCAQIFPVNLDISKAVIVKDESQIAKIKLSESVGVGMKYPNYTAMKSTLSSELEMDRKIRMIYNSLDFIWNGDDVTNVIDVSFEDFNTWIEDLTDSNFAKLESWVDHLPTFEIVTSKECPRCKFNHHIHYDDFQSFFL